MLFESWSPDLKELLKSTHPGRKAFYSPEEQQAIDRSTADRIVDIVYPTIKLGSDHHARLSDILVLMARFEEQMEDVIAAQHQHLSKLRRDLEDAQKEIESYKDQPVRKSEVFKVVIQTLIAMIGLLSAIGGLVFLFVKKAP